MHIHQSSKWVMSLGLITAIINLAWPSDAQADAETWPVTVRKRVEGEDGFRTVQKTAHWNPHKTAIIIIDMWDDHHCKSAAQRVTEMAPVMNRIIRAARTKGLLIIHAPSDCMDFYRDSPARRRARQAPMAAAAAKFQWNHFNPDQEGFLEDRLERGGCSCDTPEPCSPSYRAWTRQIKDIEIAATDVVSADGQEIHNVLQQAGIENVILMGVHTNRCVLGRPFGIRQMVYLGRNVVLCRDLTDSYHRDPGRHFDGLRQIIQHIETYWCPTITSESITGRPPFRFQADQQEKPQPSLREK